MKRWIVTLEWYEDRGMYETRIETKEFPIQAEDEDTANDRAMELVERLGAHDYAVVEA